MIEQGIRDFAIAKRKAAERLGATTRGVLPDNRMIEARLAERQRIFDPENHPDHLRALRETALAVMAVLAEFDARLVGAVLTGTATSNAVVELHAFSDFPEAVADKLIAHYGGARTVERRCRITRSETCLMPGYRFSVNGDDVLVQVFPVTGLRQAPLSPVDLRPMKRAKRAQVLALLAS